MAKKLYIQHNSPATLRATINNVAFYFPPAVKIEVFDKAAAEAAILDFNSVSPNFKMELVEEGESDVEVLGHVSRKEEREFDEVAAGPEVEEV